MTKIAIPSGYALVRLDDLAALQAARQAPPPPPPDPQPASATMGGLREALAHLIARQNGLSIPLAEDIPAATVVATMTLLAAAFLAELMPSDRATKLLQDLGLTAAKEAST